MPLLWDLFSLFPAHAGVILYFQAKNGEEQTFPRPRGGDPPWDTDDPDMVKLFPAHAGVILDCNLVDDRRTPFPRPRGGDPKNGDTASTIVLFSPPTRG